MIIFSFPKLSPRCCPSHNDKNTKNKNENNNNKDDHQGTVDYIGAYHFKRNHPEAFRNCYMTPPGLILIMIVMIVTVIVMTMIVRMNLMKLTFLLQV